MGGHTKKQRLESTRRELRKAFCELERRILARNKNLEFYATQDYIGVRRKGDGPRARRLAHFWFSREVFHFYVHHEDYCYYRNVPDASRLNKESKKKVRNIIKNHEVVSPNEKNKYWYVKIRSNANIDELLRLMSPFLGSGLTMSLPERDVNTESEGFDFEAGAGHREISTSTKRAVEGGEIQTDNEHRKLLDILYEQKKNKYGEDNVRSEQPLSGNRKIDLVVQKGSEYCFYEVKTYDNDRLCIREAIGQLLEYSYWPGCKTAKRLVVAGKPELTEEGKKYLEKLRKKLNIPVYYEQITS
ncbi:MAG: hypothetical protein ACR2NQ_02530 [Thermodesulfobacteriota bacterium]